MLGETISHYRILEKLGQGGMGEVYLAEDTRLGRKVAVKFLAPELTGNREALIRFRNEARAAAELSHTNIATIHDIGESEGRSFLVLEYLEGQTLKNRVAQGPLPIDDVLRIADAIAAGLSEAHARGIVHRDIKSDNIMLTDRGESKILDFGLSRIVEATRFTRPGTTVGTVGYMSPEQVRGEHVDARSDIWSLGAVIYETLTGRLPFIGDAAAILAQVQASEVAPPSSLRTGTPLELERIVLKCLERDPGFRYQTAEDLRADLRRFGSGIHDGLPGSRPADRRPPPRSRNRLILSVPLVLLIVALTWWRLNSGSPTNPPGLNDTLAVIDFSHTTPAVDAETVTALMSWVDVGLIDGSPLRVISRTLILDLHRRRFGDGAGNVSGDRALELARDADARFLLSGSIGALDGAIYASWQLSDCTTGELVGAGRATDPKLASIADAIVEGAVERLSDVLGLEVSQPLQSATAMSTASLEAYRHYLRGTVASRQQRFRDAIDAFKRALEIDEGFALGYLGLAREYAWRIVAPETDYLKAAWDHRASLNVKDRMRVEAWYEGFAEPDTMIMRCEEILRRWPDDYDTHYDLSEYLRFKRLHELSRHAVDRALQFFPGDVALLEVRAGTLGSYSLERLRANLQLTELEPGNANHWDNVGLSYLYRSLADSAEWAFREALRMDPDFLPSHMGISAVAFARGQNEEAIRILRELLERPELNDTERRVVACEDRYPPLGLAQILTESGRLEAAAAVVQEASTWVSESRSENFRTWTMVSLWTRADAVHRLVDAARRDERVRGPVIIQALAATGSVDSARAHLERIPRQRWRLWRVARARAEVHLAAGEADSALAALLESPPPDAWIEAPIGYERALARAYAATGQTDEAVRVLRGLLGRWDGHALGHYELGIVYQEMGRFREALTEFDRCLELWSNADPGLAQFEDSSRRVQDLMSSLR